MTISTSEGRLSPGDATPAELSPDDPASLRHLPALDGVRGLAILLVLLTHLGAILRDTGLGTYFEFGWVGVDLFFVLSGFLITRILTGTRAESGYYRRFYIRRGLRIWPLYYVYVAVTVLLMRFLGHFPTSFPVSLASPLWLFLLFVQNLNSASLFCYRDSLFSITWSLCIEEHFYLLWPACVRNLSRRGLLAILSAVLVASPLLRLLASAFLSGSAYSIWYQTVTRFTPLHLDAICAGCILSLIWADVQNHRDTVRWLTAILTFGLLGSLFCLHHQTDARIFSFCFSALAATFGGLIGLALKGCFGFLFLNAPLRYLGKISYGLYLIHPAIFLVLQSHRILNRAGWSSHPVVVESAAAIVALTLSVAIAAASWHFFERRVLSLKRRLAP